MEPQEYIITKAVAAEWEDAMELCWRTFLKFEMPDYGREGTGNFLKFISGQDLYKLFLSGAYKMYVAKDKGKIIGVLTLRGQGHISLLFVDGKYHLRGIGKRLVKQAQKDLHTVGENKLTVNSSPYAVGFYHSLGFMDCDKERESDGIRFTPMICLEHIE